MSPLRCSPIWRTGCGDRDATSTRWSMSEPGAPIDAAEMRERIAALCLGGSAALPRRQRDLHVLLASATLWMEPGSVYNEKEVNEGLQRWLDEGCPSLRVDAVTLRRELVDRVYLDRDDSG